MHTRSLLLGAAALLALVGGSPAADAPAAYDPRQAFAESDTDHSGAVDRRELYDRSVEVFFLADANRDRVLVAEELRRLPHRDDLARGDANHDGRLTIDEYVRVRDLEFESADRDKDGVLSVDEVVAAYEVGERP